MTTVEGRAWKRKRIQALEDALETSPTDEQRAAIEKELEELRNSLRGWRAWLWPTRLPHEH
jgi:hypothetical protein